MILRQSNYKFDYFEFKWNIIPLLMLLRTLRAYTHAKSIMIQVLIKDWMGIKSYNGIDRKNKSKEDCWLMNKAICNPSNQNVSKRKTAVTRFSFVHYTFSHILYRGMWWLSYFWFYSQKFNKIFSSSFFPLFEHIVAFPVFPAFQHFQHSLG